VWWTNLKAADENVGARTGAGRPPQPFSRTPTSPSPSERATATYHGWEAPRVKQNKTTTREVFPWRHGSNRAPGVETFGRRGGLLFYQLRVQYPRRNRLGASWKSHDNTKRERTCSSTRKLRKSRFLWSCAAFSKNAAPRAEESPSPPLPVEGHLSHHDGVRHRENDFLRAVVEPGPFRGPGATEQLVDVPMGARVHRFRQPHPAKNEDD